MAAFRRSRWSERAAIAAVILAILCQVTLIALSVLGAASLDVRGSDGATVGWPDRLVYVTVAPLIPIACLVWGLVLLRSQAATHRSAFPGLCAASALVAALAANVGNPGGPAAAAATSAVLCAFAALALDRTPSEFGTTTRTPLGPASFSLALAYALVLAYAGLEIPLMHGGLMHGGALATLCALVSFVGVGGLYRERPWGPPLSLLLNFGVAGLVVGDVLRLSLPVELVLLLLAAGQALASLPALISRDRSAVGSTSWMTRVGRRIPEILLIASVLWALLGVRAGPGTGWSPRVEGVRGADHPHQPDSEIFEEARRARQTPD